MAESLEHDLTEGLEHDLMQHGVTEVAAGAIRFAVHQEVCDHSKNVVKQVALEHLWTDLEAVDASVVIDLVVLVTKKTCRPSWISSWNFPFSLKKFILIIINI